MADIAFFLRALNVTLNFAFRTKNVAEVPEQNKGQQTQNLTVYMFSDLTGLFARHLKFTNIWISLH